MRFFTSWERNRPGLVDAGNKTAAANEGQTP